MGGRQIDKKQYTGEITSGLKPQAFQLAILNYIYQQLPIWRDDPDRALEQSEPKLNSQLCKFLDSHARVDFPMIRFDHEEYQTEQRRVDISASPAKRIFLEAKLYTIYDTVLVIECKRLPAPSSSREKEYVTGRPPPEKIKGGIQRFKLGLHAAKHDVAAMIGYIQDSSCDWHAMINGWISKLVTQPIGDGCIWTANETLKPLEEDKAKGIASYCSAHSRTGEVASNEIKLYHLWITMNKRDS